MTRTKHEISADLGVQALGRYISHTGQGLADIEDGTAISDLITDVLHVAADNDLDVAVIMRRAYDNFHEESDTPMG